jgi:hypothetical protein
MPCKEVRQYIRKRQTQKQKSKPLALAAWKKADGEATVR